MFWRWYHELVELSKDYNDYTWDVLESFTNSERNTLLWITKTKIYDEL